MAENLHKAIELIQLISDEQLQRYTATVMELLATGDLQRDFNRAERAANAMMHEFHKEVSIATLNAVVINLALGAFSTHQDDLAEAYERLFRMLQDDPALFSLTLHLASYCEVLAPALKREAESIIAEGSTTPTPTPKNRS